MVRIPRCPPKSQNWSIEEETVIDPAKRISVEQNESQLKDSLFWPTVGPILSGDSPGTSLYSVFIFSNSVYNMAGI